MRFFPSIFVCFIFILFLTNQAPVLANTASFTTDSTEDFDLGTYIDTASRTFNGTTGVQLIAGGGPEGTKYRRAVTINNTGVDSILTNFVVSLNLDTSALILAGKMQADCGDIRFRDSDATTEIEDFEITDCNSETTTIKLKVPSIPASSTTSVYLYYGANDTLTSQSSTQDNLLISEDMQSAPAGTLKGFPAATYDLENKYVQLTKNSVYEWGALEYTGNPGSDFDTSFEFWSGGGSGADAVYFYVYASTTPEYESFNSGGYLIDFNEFLGYIVLRYGENNLLSYVSQANMGDSAWHTARIIKSGQNFKIYYDDSLVIDYTDEVSRNISNNLLGWGARNGGDTNYHRIRNLRVSRASVDPEPSITFGNEEEALVTSGTWESPENESVYELGSITDWGDGSAGSTAFSAAVANLSGSEEIEFQIRTASSIADLTAAPYISIGTASSGTIFTKTKSELVDLNILALRFVQIKTLLSSSNGGTPALQSVTLSYSTPTVVPTSSSSNSSNTSSSQSSSSTCGGTAPGAPNLFQIDTTETTARLYFSPIPGNVRYYVSFSGKALAEEHGTEVLLGNEGVQSYTVTHLSPNTTYYFKVRGQDGCSPGAWSSIKSAMTESDKIVLASETPVPGTTHTSTTEEEDIASTESADDDIAEATHNVLIKVEHDGKPLANAKIELHSNPKYGTTNEQGEVLFSNVEKGEHTLKIAYANYTAEQKVVVNGEQKDFNVSVNVELNNKSLLPTWGWIGILLAVCVGCGMSLIRRKK